MSLLGTEVRPLERKVSLLDLEMEPLEQKVGLLERKVRPLEQKVEALEPEVRLLGRKVAPFESEVGRRDLEVEAPEIEAGPSEDRPAVPDARLTAMKLQVILEPSEEGGYTAIVPALPGCLSEGETRDEALENIREAIALYLEPIEDDGEFAANAEVLEVAV